MQNLQQKLLLISIFAWLAILTGVVTFLLNRPNQGSDKFSSTNFSDSFGETRIKEIEKCSKDCEEKILEIVSKSLSTLSGQPKLTATSVPAKVVRTKQTVYIPLNGSFLTTSTDWVDIKTSDVYIDLKNDYSETATPLWEATLKIEQGNGVVFARLFDVTHAIAVSGSEISANSPTFTLVSSGNLSFWAGRNLYRVQIKSLTSLPAYIESARIKVVY